MSTKSKRSPFTDNEDDWDKRYYVEEEEPKGSFSDPEEDDPRDSEEYYEESVGINLDGE
jgi:hypothetical protein